MAAPAPRFYFKKVKYKYTLTRNVRVRLREKFWPASPIKTDWFEITVDGWLTIFKGYGWDGCSGPTHEDDSNMFGGLIHDVLYQAIRLGFYPESLRHEIDHILQRVCRANGMGKFRAWYYFEGVNLGAGWAVKKACEPVEESAPANWPE